MPTLNIFQDDAFSMSSLTASVNKMPFVPGQLGAMGVFEEEGITTTTCMVELLDGQLGIIEPTPRGGVGETFGSEKAELRPFEVPHLQFDGGITADQVQGVRAFGSETELETVQNVVDKEMARGNTYLDLTLEVHRVGAIKGQVISKKGTVITDVYRSFGIAPTPAISLQTANASSILRDTCEDVVMQIEDLLDANYSEIRCLCGPDLWRKVTSHKSVRDVMLMAGKVAELQGRTPKSVEIGGIVFERYRTGRKAAAANNKSPFIAPDEGRIVFSGVPGLYLTRFAPADYMETVNTMGRPRYANQYVREDKKGVKMDVQSNPLNLCTRPEILIELKP